MTATVAPARIPELDGLRGLAVILFAFAATLVVAALSWRFFEKPLIRRGRRYSYGECPLLNSPAAPAAFLTPDPGRLPLEEVSHP